MTRPARLVAVERQVTGGASATATATRSRRTTSACWPRGARRHRHQVALLRPRREQRQPDLRLGVCDGERRRAREPAWDVARHRHARPADRLCGRLQPPPSGQGRGGAARRLSRHGRGCGRSPASTCSRCCGNCWCRRAPATSSPRSWVPRRRRLVAGLRWSEWVRPRRSSSRWPTRGADGCGAGEPVLDPAELPDFSAERFGSNAVALGRELTGGSGALLGNPHFPWFGIEPLLRRAPDDPGPIRRDGRVDLRLPARQHRLQPPPRVEPHRLDGAAVRLRELAHRRRATRRRTCTTARSCPCGPRS